MSCRDRWEELIDLVRQHLPPYTASVVAATSDTIPRNAMMNKYRSRVISLREAELAARRRRA
jgi:hypothetical protein